MKATKTILAYTAILLSASAIVLAVARRPAPAMAPKHARAQVKEAAYDTVLLKKFSSLLQSMDFNKRSFLYEGRFNIRDGKDSSNNVKDLPFLYSKEGKAFYSKVGEDEVINSDGTNIYIEQKTKRIVFSHQEFSISPTMGNPGQLIQKMRSEDYSLIKSLSAGKEEISMVNEHHISCKELSVTADTSGKLQKVLLRYSDVTDPLNKAKDRSVEIDKIKIETDPHIGRFPGIKDVVKETGGKMVLRERYAAYELITL